MGITLRACCDLYASIQYAAHTFTQPVFFLNLYQTKCLHDSTLKNSKLQVDTDFLSVLRYRADDLSPILICNVTELIQTRFHK